jgi:hypothetical protein
MSIADLTRLNLRALPVQSSFFSLSRLALLALAFSVPAFGQSADQRLADLERKLDHSLQVIEELSNRIKQLEQPTIAGTNNGGTSQTSRLDVIEQEVSQIVAANATHDADESGLAIHGFADVGFGLTSNGNRNGFSVGSLDFYLAPQLGEHTRALFEVITEVGADGAATVDLERAQLGYSFGDTLTAWLGRFHTPVGYYNAAFHHGQQIATSLRRAQFLEFEDKGGILPMHTTGLWLTGTRHETVGKITYDLWAGNSPAIADNELAPNAGGSTNHNLSVGANAGYQFGENWDGLKIGAHFLRGRIADDQALRNTTTTNIYGIYAIYETESWEDFAELYRFRNRDESGGSGVHMSNAGFVQLGYRMEPYTPYLRYERTRLDQSDNYFSQLNSGMSYWRAALGLRYDIDLKSALKFEIAPTHYTDRVLHNDNEAQLQYSIRF